MAAVGEFESGDEFCANIGVMFKRIDTWGDDKMYKYRPEKKVERDQRLREIERPHWFALSWEQGQRGERLAKEKIALSVKVLDERENRLFNRRCEVLLRCKEFYALVLYYETMYERMDVAKRCGILLCSFRPIHEELFLHPEVRGMGILPTSRDCRFSDSPTPDERDDEEDDPNWEEKYLARKAEMLQHQREKAVECAEEKKRR
jgi:hypothetical protein